MIKQETAAKIWNCYREIETSKKLLEDLEKAKQDRPHDPHAQLLRDAFGRRKSLELGIPNGGNGHRLFDVSSDLADAVIKSHIARKETELLEMNEQAKLELDGQPTPPVGLELKRIEDIFKALAEKNEKAKEEF